MSQLCITKIFHFEMAHALCAYDGACANIHGHSYRLEVSVTGKPINDKNHPKNGMIMDFGDLKHLVESHILQEVDHALVLNNATAPDLVAKLREHHNNIVLYSYQPTSENLLTDFASRLEKVLPAHVSLASIRMYETANSYAQWTR